MKEVYDDFIDDGINKIDTQQISDIIRNEIHFCQYGDTSDINDQNLISTDLKRRFKKDY